MWDHDHEMFHPERDEVGHYYRVEELRLGRRYRRGDRPPTGPTGEPITVVWDAAVPMRPDQRVADQPPGSPIRLGQDAFNGAYCALLAQLDRAFDGRPEELRRAVGAMYRLRTQAEALMRMPLDGGPEVAGPTFEWVPVDERG